MAQTSVAQPIRITRLKNESAEYLARRDELRTAELESVRIRERVAELRRSLPRGAEVQDYEFLEGPRDLRAGDEPVRRVRLSQLFTKPDRSLVVYQFMFGKLQKKPCPMCTLIADSLNGVAHHINENADLVIVAASSPSAFREHARRQGWDNLRLLTAPEQRTFKYDMGGEDAEGNQDSTITVFTRDPNGTIRHYYSAHPGFSPEQRERGLDLLSPVYNVLDLTPQGRGDWYATLAYSPQVVWDASNQARKQLRSR